MIVTEEIEFQLNILFYRYPHLRSFREGLKLQSLELYNQIQCNEKVWIAQYKEKNGLTSHVEDMVYNILTKKVKYL